jgi:DNA mismatch repair protein MLH3
MFNDELSDTQCCLLLSRLAKCAFPFQCAHGRPSLIPLIDLGTLHDHGLSDDEDFHNSRERFGVRFKSWKHEMVEMIV